LSVFLFFFSFFFFFLGLVILRMDWLRY
jgi:hypothetical protein